MTQQYIIPQYTHILSKQITFNVHPSYQASKLKMVG